MSRFPFVAVVVLGLAAAARPQPDDPTDGLADPDLLKAAGLNPADGAALVGYLKLRTASDDVRGKLDEYIRRFAADKFEDRLAAAAAAERLGPAVISPLRAVIDNKETDPEVAYRAGLVLKKIQTVDHTKVSAAAVRAVAMLKPAGAVAVLLGFLPLADSEAVADDIRRALKELAVRDGKADPALVAGLADKSPVCRTAAYTALVEGGPAGQRVRIPDAFPAVKDAVRRDPDVEAKFRGLWVLTHTTREKEFVPDLIAMIPVLPRGRLWQLEDLLLRLAGEHPKGGRFGKTSNDLVKTREAWAGWWATSTADLTKADLTPRVKGLTDLVLMDPNFGRWAVVTLGADLKEAWRLGGNPQNMHPFDARVLPTDRVLLTEQNYQRVTERDKAGNILHVFNVSQPVSAEVLPNGNWLVVGRSMIAEVKPGQAMPVASYTRPRNPPMVNGFDIVAGARLPTGEVVFVTANQNPVAGKDEPNLHRLDEKLAPVGKSLKIGPLQNGGMSGIDVTADGKVLVCHPDKVAEYDVKDGKPGWSFDVGFPTSVQRLTNGNTLVASVNANRVLEVSPDGVVVWEHTGAAGTPNIARARRR